MPPRGSWEDLKADLAHTAVLTDFDGTLSEIVVDPTEAHPLPEAVETLETLADRAHTVAVVSGRPLAFLEAHFGPAVTLSGLYGLETRVHGMVHRPPQVEQWRAIVSDAVNEATRDLPDDVRVEPKGLALTLHYREVPHRQDLIERWAASCAARTGLVMAAARCSVELNPPIEVDKGTVVAGFATAPGVRSACYLGDDRADLVAFEALAGLRSSALSTYTVAVRSAETPPEVLAGVDMVVDGPRAAVALLAGLAAPT